LNELKDAIKQAITPEADVVADKFSEGASVGMLEKKPQCAE